MSGDKRIFFDGQRHCIDFSRGGWCGRNWVEDKGDCLFGNKGVCPLTWYIFQIAFLGNFLGRYLITSFCKTLIISTVFQNYIFLKTKLFKVPKYIKNHIFSFWEFFGRFLGRCIFTNQKQ